MSQSTQPSIQAARFDCEALAPASIAVTESAARGPTYLRVNGQIAFVVLAVQVFDQVWPDRARIYATDEIPEHLWRQLLEGCEGPGVDEPPRRRSHLTVVRHDPE